jgi:hypothetical protein
VDASLGYFAGLSSACIFPFAAILREKLHQMFQLRGFSWEEQGKEFIGGFFSGKYGIGTLCALFKWYGD